MLANAALRAQTEGQAPYVGEIVDRNAQLSCQLQDTERRGLRLEGLVEKQERVIQELSRALAAERTHRSVDLVDQSQRAVAQLMTQRSRLEELVLKQRGKIKALKDNVYKLQSTLDHHQQLDSLHASIDPSASMSASAPASASVSASASSTAAYLGLLSSASLEQQHSNLSFSETSPRSSSSLLHQQVGDNDDAEVGSRTENALAAVSAQLAEVLSGCRTDGLPTITNGEGECRAPRCVRALQQREEELRAAAERIRQLNEQLEEMQLQQLCHSADFEQLPQRLKLCLRRLEACKSRERLLQEENSGLRSQLQWLMQQQRHPDLSSSPTVVGGRGEDERREGERMIDEAQYRRHVQEIEEAFLTKYVAAFAIICEKERIINDLNARLLEEIRINEDAARRIIAVSSELAAYSAISQDGSP